MFGKKCIGKEIVELALFLSLLYGSNDLLFGGDDVIHDSNLDGNELFNDTGPGGGVLGSTYRHRHSGFDLSRHLWSKELEDPRLEEWSNFDENAYYRSRVIDELTRVNLVRYNQLGQVGDQEVTAYILDGTSSSALLEEDIRDEDEVEETSLLEEMEHISLSLEPLPKDSFAEPTFTDSMDMERGDLDFLHELNELNLHLADEFSEHTGVDTRVNSFPHNASLNDGIDELNLALLNVYDGDDLSGEAMMVGISPFDLHDFDDTTNKEQSDDGTNEKKNEESICEGVDDLWETDSGIFDSHTHSDSSDEDSQTTILRDQSIGNDTTDFISEQLCSDGRCGDDEWVENALNEMLQTAPPHHPPRPTPHPPLHHLQHQQRGFQVHGLMSGMRGGGVEGRYQDISALNFLPGGESGMGSHFSPSYLPHPFHPHQGHYAATGGGMTYVESGRGPLLHNTTLPQINISSPYPGMDIGATSSALLGSTSHNDTSDQGPANYNRLMDSPTSPIYFQGSSGGTTTDLSTHPNDTMLSSFMSPDDTLQLMEIMSEGICAMRVDGPIPIHHHHPPHLSHLPQPMGGYGDAEERLEGSTENQTGLTSMVSQRLRPMLEPILSDNEWTQNDPGTFTHHYNTEKLRGYDYFGKGEGRQRIVAPVPQKKHQMFGKRVVQEGQSRPLAPPYSPRPTITHPSNPSTTLHPHESKYHSNLHFPRQECVLGSDVGLANHTYSLPPTHPDHPNMTARTQRTQPKDKTKREHMSRDEKKAQLLSLPLTTDQIVNLPMDEFNERLSKHDLSETQLSLIRDIRRRGKNKVAAQNCRKRKIDQITQLENEVSVIRQRKDSLLRDNANLEVKRTSLLEKYSYLYRHVFQNLRDEDGEPYNPDQWYIGPGPVDGNLHVMRKEATTLNLNYSSREDIQDGTFLRRPTRNPPKSKDDPKKGQRP